MPAFVWKGKTRDGKVVSGEKVADNKEAVMALLRRDQILVSSVKEKGREFVLPKFGGGVPSKDLAIFTRQFSVMIDAGLPLVQCLEILGSQQENKTFAKVLQQTRMDVEGGRQPRRRHAQAAQGVRRPLHEHDRGGGGGRHPRHHPEAPRHLHREERQAEGPGQGGDGLPGGGHLDRRHRHHRHPLEGHPHLRRDVRGPGRRAAAAHPVRDRALQLAGPAAAVPRGRRHPAGGRLQAVLRHPRRPPRRGRGRCSRPRSSAP